MEHAPGVAFDLDGDGTYETDGPTATLQLEPGTHELGVRARTPTAPRRSAGARSTCTPSPFEIVPPPALVRPGRAGDVARVRSRRRVGHRRRRGVRRRAHARVPGRRCPPRVGTRGRWPRRDADRRRARRPRHRSGGDGVGPPAGDPDRPDDDVPRRRRRPGRRAGDAGVRAQRRWALRRAAEPGRRRLPLDLPRCRPADDRGTRHRLDRQRLGPHRGDHRR